MKVKLVFESLKDVLKPISKEEKDSLFSDIKKNYINIKKILKSIAQEIKSDSTWNGFMNVSEDFFVDEEKNELIKYFVLDYNNGREYYWNNFLDSIDLYLDERPGFDEIIFYLYVSSISLR